MQNTWISSLARKRSDWKHTDGECSTPELQFSSNAKYQPVRISLQKTGGGLIGDIAWTTIYTRKTLHEDRATKACDQTQQEVTKCHGVDYWRITTYLLESVWDQPGILEPKKAQKQVQLRSAKVKTTFRESGKKPLAGGDAGYYWGNMSLICSPQRSHSTLSGVGSTFASSLYGFGNVAGGTILDPRLRLGQSITKDKLMPGLQIVVEEGEWMGAFMAEDTGRHQIWWIMHTLVTVFDVLHITNMIVMFHVLNLRFSRLSSYEHRDDIGADGGLQDTIRLIQNVVHFLWNRSACAGCENYRLVCFTRSNPNKVVILFSLVIPASNLPSNCKVWVCLARL